MSSFKVNIKANLAAMAGDSKYQDLKDGEMVVFRFAPPGDTGLIWWPTKNHYKLKDPDDKTKGIALADLAVHGNDETGNKDYIMDLSEVLESTGNTSEKAIGKGIKGNFRFYAQGWTNLDPTAGKAGKWSRLRFIALPKTPAVDMMDTLENMQKMGTPCATDVTQGQAMLISRKGTGYSTKYKVERSGVVEDLNKLIPDWKDQIVVNVPAHLNLTILPREEQKRIAQLTYPDLDWEKLAAEHGL